jgi:hypothetical protein
MARLAAGYKSRLRYSDADYFNLSDRHPHRDAAPREKVRNHRAGQARYCEDAIQDGHRAAKSCRDSVHASYWGAGQSLCVNEAEDIDLVVGSVYQDARDVKTEFSKTFTTFFFPSVKKLSRSLLIR